jgi:hypothetical protein
MKMGVSVNGNLWLRSPSRKKAVFMDGKVFSRSASKKMGIFLAEKVKKQKETPPKGCLRKYLAMRFLGYARNDIDQITY